MYRSVPPRIDLPAMEREVLAFWKQSSVFERSLAQTEGNPQWVFYEGPPTANGTPGTHQPSLRYSSCASQAAQRQRRHPSDCPSCTHS